MHRFLKSLACSPLMLFLGVQIGWSDVVRGPYLQSGTPTSITVKWRTDFPTDSRVFYSRNANNLNLTAGAPTLTTNHQVELTGLLPNTKYYYGIGDTQDGVVVSGLDYYFITAPPQGTAKQTRIWAIGDSGTASAGQLGAAAVWNAYREFSEGQETDVWLMLGDNAYYNGEDHEYQTAVFDLYNPLLQKTVLWSTIGNHETYGSATGNGTYAYHDIFTFPTEGEAGGVASGTENYYSFDYANIHFVVLDSEISSRSKTGPMMAWLMEDLEQNTNEWVIAVWHSPPYTKGSHNSDSTSDSAGRLFQMRTNFVPVLESYGVDLVLGGHSHIYERSYLLKGHFGVSSTLESTMLKDAGSGRWDDTGPYYKPVSGAGANEGTVYVVAGSSGWATFATGRHPAMFYHALELGSLVIDVHTNRLDARFLRETGQVDDWFTIIKSGPPPPFKLVMTEVDAGAVSVRWKSVAGETYQVVARPKLESGNWAPVSDVITATGATTSWTNFLDGDPQRFYRVQRISD